MKRLLILACLLSLAACEEEPRTAKSTQAEKAREAANSIRFTENAEIENIKRRLELTADPGKLGFILLLNQSGQPIMYEGVKGKVTSGGKRLTEPDRSNSWGNGGNNVVRAAPSDEGTWGHSGEYIYYWNLEGVYRQWNGDYLYSDQPIRLRIEPLIVSVKSAAN